MSKMINICVKQSEWKCPYCGATETPNYFEYGYLLCWTTKFNEGNDLVVNWESREIIEDSQDGCYLRCAVCGRRIDEYDTDMDSGDIFIRE